jgi:hypothetical protein
LRKLAIRPQEAETEPVLSPPFLHLGLVDLEIRSPARTFVCIFFKLLRLDSSLPQLEKLAFVNVVDGNDEEVDEADVLEILRNAAEPVTQRRSIVAGRAQLQSLRVVSRIVFFSPKDLWPFTKLKESGMNLYIGTHKRSFI